MTSKPFIHPDILIQIKETVNGRNEDIPDQTAYGTAKFNGTQNAEKILRQLFPQNEALGTIESHFNTDRLSSEKLKSYREQIISVHYQKKTFSKELKNLTSNEASLAYRLMKLEHSWFRFFYKKKITQTADELTEIRAKISLLNEVSSEFFVNLNFQFETQRLKEAYSDFCSSFTTLKTSNKIWDIVYQQVNLETKAAASTLSTRKEVTGDFKAIEVIKTAEKVLHLENSNGGDYYFYPNFIAYFKNRDEIALLEYSDLYIKYQDQRFLEESNLIPDDTSVVGETWYRVNKDGSADKRFTSNYKIPIVLYGSLHLKTTSGINDMYYVSDIQKTKHFSDQFNKYQTLISV